MKEILNIYKLEKNLSRKKRSTNILIMAILLVSSIIFSYGLIVAANLIIGDEITIGTFSLLVLIYQLILFFINFGDQMKRVYEFKDKVLLAYMPVDKKNIYLGKLLYSFLNTYKLGLMLIIPFFLVYTLFVDMSLSYFLWIIPISMILPLLSFAIASFVVTPIVVIKNKVKNNFFINLALNVGLVTALFYLYNKIVFNIARIVLFNDLGKGNILLDLAKKLDNKYIPSTWIISTLLNNNISNLGLFIGSSAIIILIAIYLNQSSFKRIFNSLMLDKHAAKIIKSKDKPKKVFTSYFNYELKSLYRSSTYSFTYIGMAIVMPFMTYYCNKFIIDFASERLGQNMIFGTTLLVILIFTSMICSTTSTFISREGESYWILKTNPNGIKKPLIAKSLVGVLFSSLAIIASVSLAIYTDQIGLKQGCFISGISLIYILGLVCMGMNINLFKPNLFYSNKENNSNIVSHLTIGLIVSILIGIYSMIRGFTAKFDSLAIVCIYIVSIFTLINVLILVLFNKKLYRRMEV